MMNQDFRTPHATLNKLMATLTTGDLMRLNAAADMQHVDPAVIAKAYLTSNGLA